jgi:hypothetical protein
MKWVAALLVAVATLAGIVASIVPASGQADKEAAPIVVTKMPPGYRDWKWISVAHEAGNLNSIGATLGGRRGFRALLKGEPSTSPTRRAPAR